MFDYILSFIIMISLLVFVHEWGHWFVAKHLGIMPIKFSIGMGPVLFKWMDKDNCQWQISAIPIGGYVQFLGDKDATSVAAVKSLNIDPSQTEKYFHLRHPKHRIMVSFAGPLASILFGILLISTLYVSMGRMTTEPVISSVLNNSPAQKADFRVGDRILSLNGNDIIDFRQVQREIGSNPSMPHHIWIERKDGDTVSRFHKTITSESVEIEHLGTRQSIPRLGIMSDKSVFVKIGPLDSIYVGVQDSINMSIDILKGIKRLITGDMPLYQIGSPVKMGEIAGNAYKVSFSLFIFMMAMFSINLGIMNLIPIPILDGGQIVLSAIEWIRGKAVADKTLFYLQTIGITFLGTGMVLLAIKDIYNLFKISL